MGVGAWAALHELRHNVGNEEPSVGRVARVALQREADDAADRARCAALRAAYAVVPGVSWGTAPAEAQTEWRTRGCDGMG